MASRVVKDFSFGVVPWRQTERGREYLLIQHRAGHWGFPKGHAEGDEAPVESARRELLEETGLSDVSIEDGPCFEERYSFDRPGGGSVHKTVRYFIGQVHSGEVFVQEAEVRAFAWGSSEQTRARMSFSQGRQLLDRAEAHLGG